MGKHLTLRVSSRLDTNSHGGGKMSLTPELLVSWQTLAVWMNILILSWVSPTGHEHRRCEGACDPAQY